ncbi:MAG: hypothetical protein DRI61_09075 [Chloroflexi bacterium]|nr:MAG: hypothetical protein DRI61_09075 [Chloroflexota bacterium]
MPDYNEFFLNSSSAIIQYETLEITHPNFSQDYFIVRNNTEGLTATLEDSSSQAFEYYPLRIDPTDSVDNLDFGISVTLGDLGELINEEIAAVIAADGFETRPTVLYRTYRSDDLTAPLVGPLRLEMQGVTCNREGAVFTARAPSLNLTTTGELYTFERFPMLRGTL